MFKPIFLVPQMFHPNVVIFEGSPFMNTDEKIHTDIRDTPKPKGEKTTHYIDYKKQFLSSNTFNPEPIDMKGEIIKDITEEEKNEIELFTGRFEFIKKKFSTTKSFFDELEPNELATFTIFFKKKSKSNVFSYGDKSVSRSHLGIFFIKMFKEILKNVSEEKERENWENARSHLLKVV